MRVLIGLAAALVAAGLTAGCGDRGAGQEPGTGAAATVRPDLAADIEVEVVQGSALIAVPGLGAGAEVSPGVASGEHGEVEDSTGRFRRSAPAPAPGLDPVLDRGPGKSPLRGPVLSFEGIAGGGELTNVTPPDAVGDIGPSHYVEWVNEGLEVFGRDGKPVSGGVVGGNALFATLPPGHPCREFNRGDPEVVYDQLAGRWVLTQFAFPLDANDEPIGPSFSCLAVSKTDDPFGEWCASAYRYSRADFYDYPKLGVWRDAYLLTANTWKESGVVSQLVVIEREPLLTCEGTPRAAKLVEDRTGTLWLPADVDGSTPPEEGRPPLFVGMQDDGWFTTGQAKDALLLLELRPDFDQGTATPRFYELPVASFDSNLCEFERPCLAVPAGGERLDALSGNLMNRAAFRRLDGRDVLAVTHTVDVDGADHAGIRWYELAGGQAGWRVADQGTFAPEDGSARWLGSAALDAAGNLAVVYAVAGPQTLPSVRYAARRPQDPPGKLALGEATLVAGGGVQTDGGNRWGDYGALTLDPLDDCTFWYTGQYYPRTDAYRWATRVVAFRLPGCPSSGAAAGGTQGGSGS